MDDPSTTDLVANLGMEIRWLGGTTSRHKAQGREDGGPGLFALFGEVGDIEGGRTSDHGHAVTIEDLDRVSGNERLEQDGGEPEAQHSDEVVRSSDVGEGEGDGPYVARRHVERLGEAPTAGDERLIGVLDALGFGGRS